MAKVTFYDSAEGVTGSAYLIECGRSKVLLDCGLIQGSREKEKANQHPFPFKIKNLDAVFLSHAHLDHSGRLPKLVAEGYSGPVYMTLPTRELLEIMLKDAAFLEQRDADWENRRRRRSGKPEIEPLFTLEDVEASLALCQGIGYGERRRVAEGIEVCYRDAGHILGSAIVEVFLDEGWGKRKLVFSGDLGNSCQALLRDPETVEDADVLLLESTYGNRNHRPLKETLHEFETILEKASRDGGNVLIPSFAVGRTQEIIFRLGELYQAGKLAQRAVYLDSPMAIAATEIYHRFQETFNSEDSATMRQAKSSSLHTFLPVLRYSRTTEDSMALNRITQGAIIIAGSGMCNGGRIRHHLKHNLWMERSDVIFIGYQAVGTPGRALVDGARTFRVADEEIVVKAGIHTLGGFSAHAGQSQLIDWVEGFRKKRPRVFLVHGEAEAKEALGALLEERGFRVTLPACREAVTF